MQQRVSMRAGVYVLTMCIRLVRVQSLFVASTQRYYHNRAFSINSKPNPRKCAPRYMQSGIKEYVSPTSSPADAPYGSYIETIRCRNFGGLINAYENGQGSEGKEQNKDIAIHLGSQPNLVAVTGETGSGKSLLVAKVIQYVMGCKATPSIIPSSNCNDDCSAEGEVVIKLTEPHLSLTRRRMEQAGLDQNLINPTVHQQELQGDLCTVEVGTLTLTRIITEQRNKSKIRLKSTFKINDKQVTLKALKTVVTPLVTIVDAAAAASALSQTKIRMDIIDTGVKFDTLSRAQIAKNMYRKRRQEREKIEQNLAQRVLPSSFSSATDRESMELLRHWVKEIDDFEAQMASFQESIFSSRGTAILLREEGDDEYGDHDSEYRETKPIKSKAFVDVLNRFVECSWAEDSTVSLDSDSIGSSFYSNLLDLRDGIKQLDDQLISAELAESVLSSLSSSQSAAYALEQSRKHLFDTSSYEQSSIVAKATEKSHDLLNRLEDALNECTKFMSDDPNGLIETLRKMRQSIHLSTDEIDIIIANWGTLSRKHGINTFFLPSLQRSLRQEIDGNAEALMELPKAKGLEKEALENMKDAFAELSIERMAVSHKLTQSVTERIKGLGMEGSRFEVSLTHCIDSASYSKSSILGIDTVDFMLLHRQVNGAATQKIKDNDERGGRLELVGSSGEKARILLAIETDLPGSIGASCSGSSPDMASRDAIAPVTVVYDEIDAHVGGRAAVALAKLLADQTRSSDRGQIISITHSPSVAAVADCHIVVQKLPMNDSLEGRVEIVAGRVEGSSRRKELARMASGDLAPDDEGLRFADALLRHGSLHKES